MKNLFAQIDHSDENEVNESFLHVMIQIAIGQEQLEFAGMMFADQCKAMLTAPVYDQKQLAGMMENLKNAAIRMGEERLWKVGQGWRQDEYEGRNGWGGGVCIDTENSDDDDDDGQKEDVVKS